MNQNKIGTIRNVLDGDLIDYLLNKYEALPHSDNGARINADTLVDQDYNKRFNEKQSLFFWNPIY